MANTHIRRFEMKIDADELVWVPCRIIAHENTTKKCKLVEPLDGWEEQRFWCSNFIRTAEELKQKTGGL